jgi:DNA-binding GntR family transcriptional regulator
MPGIENEEFCRKPLHDLIQDRGINKIFKVVQTIEVAELRSDAAHLLNVRDGTPGILLHRLLIGVDRNPIAYTRLSGPGRQYKIQTEFERIG